MNVAEKLRALGPDLDAVLDELIGWIDTDLIGCLEVEQRGEQMRLRLRNALPEIIAVVEAAERQKHGSNCASWRQRRDAANVIRSACDCKLAAALAALDEQLGDLSSATEPEAPTPR